MTDTTMKLHARFVKLADGFPAHAVEYIVKHSDEGGVVASLIIYMHKDSEPLIYDVVANSKTEMIDSFCTILESLDAKVTYWKRINGTKS